MDKTQLQLNDLMAARAGFHEETSGGGMMHYSRPPHMVNDTQIYCMIDAEGDSSTASNLKAWRLGWYDQQTGECLAFHYTNFTLPEALTMAAAPNVLYFDPLAYAGTFNSLNAGCRHIQDAIGQPDGDCAGMMFSGPVEWNGDEYEPDAWAEVEAQTRSLIFIELLVSESHDAKLTRRCLEVLEKYSAQEMRYAETAVREINSRIAASLKGHLLLTFTPPEWSTVDPADVDKIELLIEEIITDVATFAQEKTQEILPGFRVNVQQR